MPVARSRELIVPIAAIVVVVVLSAIAAVLSPPGSSGLPPGSSFAKDRDGSAAAYLTLAALGYDVRRSFDPLPALSATPSGSVLILADPTERASEQDRRALRAFIVSGGTVLVSGCAGASFLSAAGADTAPVGTERVYYAMLPSPLTAGVPRVSMASACTAQPLGGSSVALYGDDRDEVVSAARIGRGLVIWWAANTPITNGAIGEGGHLELLLNAIGSPDRAVIWDEYYHGQRRSLWSYSRQTPLPWLLAQLGLVAVAAAATFVRRRLPVREPYVESRTSPLEFVETMAGLYARAGSAREAAIAARHRLRRLLLDTTGVGAGAGDERLAAAAAARFRIDAGELTRALRAADDGAATIETALPLVQQLQGFAAAVDRRGG